MARRSLVTTLVVVGGGLITAAAHYRVVPVPEPSALVESAESRPATQSAVRPAAAQQAAGLQPGAAAAMPADEKEGAEAGEQVLRSQLCDAIYAVNAPCPLNAHSGAQTRAQTAASTEAIVAIFPDPIHTHLSLRFDRNVDALIAAAQDAGWYFDRQWIPWSWMNPGMGTGEPADEKDLPELVKTRNYRHGFESVPGFISFRPIGGKQTRPLIAFIVGDSPISGIIPGQFSMAYSLVSSMADGDAPGSSDKELRILGPSFTGSISSLASLLAANSEPESSGGFRSIRILSPTIGRDLSDVRFDGREFARVRPTPKFESYGVSQNCRILSVVDLIEHQTEEDQQAAQAGEPQLGLSSPIALLSEDETAYGRVAMRIEANSSKHPAAHTDSTCDLSQKGLLHLTFPRDISHLRSAYQQKSIWGFGGTQSGGTSLGLDYADPHVELDAVPNFSGAQNAASLETTLHQITETLSERDIRVVLLSATDVFDELFLARLLSRLAPNLSVVVLDSDALLLHRGGGDTYTHVFVASPFPSLPLDLFWAAPAGRLKDQECAPRLFPSESAQGAYLAAGTLLVDTDPRHHGLSFVREQFCSSQYSSPFEPTSRPPLWLLSVEDGKLWPIAAVPLRAQAPYNVPATAWPTSASYRQVTGLARTYIPVTLWLGLIGLALLAMVHTYGSVAIGVRSPVLWDYNLADLPSRRLKLILEFGLTLLLMAAIRFLVPPELNLLVVHSRLFSDFGYAFVTLLAVLGGLQVCALVSGSTPWLALTRPRLPGNAPLLNINPQRLVPLSWIAGAVGGGLALGVSTLPWNLLTREPGGRVEFFERYRALWPFSGSAPTLPILLVLLAVALALVSRMGRLYFVGCYRPWLPADTPEDQALPSEASVAPIHHFLSGWLNWRVLRIWAFILPALLVFHYALHWAAPTTLDGGTYTLLLKVLAGLLVALLTFDLLRALTLWQMLRSRVLRPLERTPLRRGFDRIRGMSWQRVWLTTDATPQSVYVPARRALELATGSPSRLGLAADPLPQPLVEGPWHDALTGGDEQGTQAWGNTLKGLATAAERILPLLVDSWKAEEGGVTAKDDTVEERSKMLDKTPSPTDAQEEFVALVYLQYIRIVLIQVRQSLFTSAACYVVLAAAVMFYPIVGRHAIEICLSTVFLFLAAAAIRIYAAINRDSILSRTTSTEPATLDFDFFVKIASFLGLPLLGLLASQFPELASTVLSYFQPALGGK